MCDVIKKSLAVIFAIVNILFLLCGLTIIIGATIMTIQTSNLSASSLSGDLYTGSIILIVTGVVIFVVAFLGCCGFIRRSLVCLIPYAICLLVIIITGLAVCIMVGLYSNVYEEKLNDTLKENFDNYKNTSDGKKIWDSIQENGKCCGMKGAGDWKDDLPKSCCSDVESDDTEESKECKKKSTEKPYVFAKGCTDILRDFFKTFGRVLFYTSLALTIFSILAFVLAVVIMCDVKNSSENADT